jgi:hypothetical protein
MKSLKILVVRLRLFYQFEAAGQTRLNEPIGYSKQVQRAFLHQLPVSLSLSKLVRARPSQMNCPFVCFLTELG